MQLLNKKTLSSQIAAERKAQIDEGVALASKIDKLRQTLSSLELQHSQFLGKMQKELIDTTKDLNLDISNKKREIEDLTLARQQLLEPLTREKEELEEREEKLEQDVSNFLILESKQKDFNKSILERQQKIVLEEERLKDLKSELVKQVDEIESKSENIRQMSVSFEEEKTNLLTSLEVKQSKILQRENEIANRELEVSIREKNLKQEEENIIKIKIQLADRSATLERAMQRIQKNATIN